jgi:hypothetical protein
MKNRDQLIILGMYFMFSLATLLVGMYLVVRDHPYIGVVVLLNGFLMVGGIKVSSRR